MADERERESVGEKEHVRLISVTMLLHLTKRINPRFQNKLCKKRLLRITPHTHTHMCVYAVHITTM